MGHFPTVVGPGGPLQIRPKLYLLSSLYSVTKAQQQYPDMQALFVNLYFNNFIKLLSARPTKQTLFVSGN